MDEVREKLKRLILEIMSLDIDRVDNAKELSKIDQWDSFNNLMLISRIEKEFRIKIGMKELDSVNTVNAVVEMVKHQTRLQHR